MASMTEAEFERNSSALWGQVEDALAVYYTFEQINGLAGTDADVLDALQRDALFWNVQKHALQTTLIIILGRIFDISGDAYSVHRLMRDAAATFGLFSHAALRIRKQRLNLSPRDLADYFIGLWEPNPDCFRPLRRALAPHVRRYKNVYRPLRDKLYAHSLTNDPADIQGLFANTNRAELEETLLTVREVVGLIQEMYQNGSEPVLGSMIHDRYRQECRQAATNVLEKLKCMHLQGGGAQP
jgi:hypothetical protein